MSYSVRYSCLEQFLNGCFIDSLNSCVLAICRQNLKKTLLLKSYFGTSDLTLIWFNSFHIFISKCISAGQILLRDTILVLSYRWVFKLARCQQQQEKLASLCKESDIGDMRPLWWYMAIQLHVHTKPVLKHFCFHQSCVSSGTWVIRGGS